MSTSPARRPVAIRRRSAAGVRLVERRGAHRPLAQQRALGRHGEGAEHPAHRQLVLLGQHLGGRHERALVAALHRHQQRSERDDRLPRTDLALQQAVHGRGQRHVGADLRDRPRSGSPVSGNGSAAWNSGTSGPSTACTIPVSSAASARFARHQGQLHAQELVELQAVRGGVALPHRLRPVDAAVRAPPVDQVVLTAERHVEWVGEAARLGAVETRTRPRVGAARSAPPPSPTAGTPARWCR